MAEEAERLVLPSTLDPEVDLQEGTVSRVRCCMSVLVATVLICGAVWLPHDWAVSSVPGSHAPSHEAPQPVALYADTPSQCPACGSVLFCTPHPAARSSSSNKSSEPSDASETFSCRDGCKIKRAHVNDNACHCSDCEDEEAWTCKTCADRGALRGLDDDEYIIHHVVKSHNNYGRDVGLGVGVGVGGAMALGLGLGFGMNPETNPNAPNGGDQTYYLVTAGLTLEVPDIAIFKASSLILTALSQVIAFLAGPFVNPLMVAVRFPSIRRRLGDGRRLQEILPLGVGIKFTDQDDAIKANNNLNTASIATIQPVLSRALSAAGAGQVTVVNWEPSPNPESFSPNSGPPGDKSFVFPDGLSLA